jgi:hypothetical protein
MILHQPVIYATLSRNCVKHLQQAAATFMLIDIQPILKTICYGK